MKRIALFGLGLFAMLGAAFAQTPDIDTPLLALALSTAIGLVLTPMLIRGGGGSSSPAWAAAVGNARIALHCSQRLTERAKMKQGILIGAALLAVAGVAFAATGYCPLCLLFWQ